MRAQLLAFVIAALSSAGVVSCAGRARPSEAAADVRPREDAVARGEWVFHAAGCALCHGKAGKGGVNNANSETGGKITGLVLIKEGYSAKDLAQRIREGVQEVGKTNPKGPVPPLRMPAYEGWLSERSIQDLVAYLFSIYPKDAKKNKDEDWGEEEDEDNDGGEKPKDKGSETDPEDAADKPEQPSGLLTQPMDIRTPQATGVSQTRTRASAR